MLKIGIIYHSNFGYTKELANEIEAGIKYEQASIFSYTAEEAKVNLTMLDECDAIIFGSPTYFGSVSAEFKSFMDSTSDVWLSQKWKNKIAAGFTCANSPNGDQCSTINQLIVFAMQHGMIWVGQDLMPKLPDKGQDPTLFNYLGSWMGLSSQAREESGMRKSLSDIDRKAANHFGQRIVNITKRFNNKHNGKL